MPTPVLQNLLTGEQVAELLGIKPQTLAKWRCSGNPYGLKSVRVGRSVRYHPDDIESFRIARTDGAKSKK